MGAVRARLACLSVICVSFAMALLACAPEPRASLRLAELEDTAPRYGTTPFPSDLFRGDDGTLLAFEGIDDITPLQSEIAATHLSQLDGFGLRPVVEVFFDGDLDGESVPATTGSIGDALVVIDVDPGSDGRGEVVPMQWRVDDIRSRVAGVPLPGTVLREGTRYAIAVRRALRDDAGTIIGPPPQQEALRASARESLPPALQDVRDALDELEAQGLAHEDLALAATFTTQHATRALLAARELSASQPAPTLRFENEAFIYRGTDRLDVLLGVPARDEQGRERWGWSNPTGLAHDNVGVIGTGTMTAPRFLSEDDGSYLPTADAFQYDADGAPIVIEPAAEMPVTFALPAAPMPASGYPVAIFGHGLGASRHQLLALAEPLTEQGWAVAGIDMNAHGSRFNDSDDDNNTASLIDGFDAPEGVGDGFGDVVGVGSTFAFLHELKNLSAMRDSIRQSALDLGALARLLRSDPDLSALAEPGAPTPRLDPANVVYLGESFGGVIGSVLSAIEPELDLFVLDVPGGGVFDLVLLGSPTMRPMVELWLSSTYGLDERLDRFHPVIGLGTAILDGADPLSYAPHTLKDRFAVGGATLSARSVVLLEVVGDEVLPNRATHALARAFGTPLLAPFVTEVERLEVVEGRQQGNVDGQTGALVQWSPATHGANWTSERGVRKFAPFTESDDEVFVTLEQSVTINNPMRATLAQVIGILESYADGAPAVEPSHIALPDFDDDGMLDEDELAAGRDPLRPED
jgi:hypothetical protein